MDDAEGISDGRADWLFETVWTVQEIVTSAATTADLAATIPDVLCQHESNDYAWLGQPDQSDDIVRVLESSGAAPERIDLGDDPSLTEHVLETGSCQIQTTHDEYAEYEPFREFADVPPDLTVVSFPVGERSVAHLYTDGPATDDRTASTFETLGESISAAIRRSECRDELDRERERLEAFRSVVSHDLGNPLNLAAGRLDLAQSECDSEHLSKVGDALEQIDTLTNEALTFVEVGRAVTDPEPLSLAEKAGECWEYVADGRGELHVSETTIRAEPQRFRRILNELFRNALAHNDGDTTVEVGPLEESFGFFVADDGHGIPADEREYVFDRGYTTDSERDGNGLAIVESIATAHGWEVSLDAHSGTRLSFRTERW